MVKFQYFDKWYNFQTKYRVYKMDSWCKLYLPIGPWKLPQSAILSTSRVPIIQEI